MQIADYNLIYQRTWGDKTFGPGPRLKGVLAHIRTELIEVEINPQDISEWADILILTLDGAMRQGFTGSEIIQAYHDKMRVNYSRNWPDWRRFSPDEPIEHVRTPDECLTKLSQETERLGLYDDITD